MKRSARSWAVLTLAALTAAAAFPRAAHAAAKSRKRRVLVTFEEGSSREERARAAREMGLNLAADFDALQVAVMEASGDVMLQAEDLARLHPNVQIEEDVYRNWLLDSPATIQETPLISAEAANIGAAMKGLARTSRKISPKDPSPDNGDGTVPW